MSISSFTKVSTKTIAGNYEKLFIGRVNDVLMTTWDAKNPLELEDFVLKYVDGQAAPRHTLGVLEVDSDSLQYTSSGEATRGYFSEQTLVFKIAQKNTESEALIEELLAGATCGLFVIRIDRQGKGWVSGLAPASKQFENLPWLSTTEAFDSGENIESVEEGNRSTITLTRKSATREFLIDDTEGTGLKTALLTDTHLSLDPGA